MGNSEEEALAARDDYKLAEKQGIGRVPALGEFATQWLKISRPDIRDITYEYNVLILNKLIEPYGHLPLNEIKPSHIKTVFSTAFSGLSDSYIRHARSLYNSLFEAAREDGLCIFNPASAKSASPHKGTYTGHRAITPQERIWIETLCTDHPAYPYAMTMLYAGLRPQEAKALNITTSVDFDNNQIHVQDFAHIEKGAVYSISQTGKNPRATRTVPLFSPLRSVLFGRKGMLVPFPKRETETKSTWRSLWVTYVTAMEQAINGHTKQYHKGNWIRFTVTPYDLRHSFITWCRDLNVELHTVIQWAGHSDSKMILSIYDEVTEDRSKSEAQKVESALLSMQNGMQNKNVSRETLTAQASPEST